VLARDLTRACSKSLKLSWIIYFLPFFPQNMAYYMFLGFSMVYYTLNSVKNSMSCIQMKDSNQHTLYNSTFQMAFNVLALGTKGKYHFDFEFL
jgi:hypothetical protein